MRATESAQEQFSCSAMEEHGKFQFLDRRNEMLAGETSNTRRFTRSGEKIADDLEKVPGAMAK
jgi:hypothetical protein